MDLQYYIQLTYAGQLSIIEMAKDSADEYEFELSTLMAALYTDPELSEYSESELQAAVMELISDQF